MPSLAKHPSEYQFPWENSIWVLLGLKVFICTTQNMKSTLNFSGTWLMAVNFHKCPGK